MRQNLRQVVLLCLCLISAGVSEARADAVSDFYKGKTVTFLIGYPPGGAYDLYARLIARHIGKYIPGTPSVLVQNMPGAGSLAAANHVASIGPQDGTLIAATGAALPFAPMLDPATARFESTKVNWLASPASFVALMVVGHQAPVTTFAQLRTTEVLMGTLNPGATPSFYAAILNDVLKTRIKLVYGYDSMSQAMLAMQRGEVQGYPTAPIDSMKRAYANLVKNNEVRFLLQIGGSASPDYPEVPFILDQATNEQDRLILDVSLGSLKIGYPYFMGPNVPRDRVLAIRKAMLDCFADRTFLAEAAAQTLDIQPVSGERVEAIVTQAYAAPDTVLARLRTIYQKQMTQ
jgi:tripartite-type tricarboxylate transporter receptor subunit TctC